jgi:hypothetical protein
LCSSETPEAISFFLRRELCPVLGFAGKAKAVVGNVEGEVLGHFVLVEHGPDFETDGGRAVQRLALACDRRGDAHQLALGGGEQLLAPA